MELKVKVRSSIEHSFPVLTRNPIVVGLLYIIYIVGLYIGL